LPKSSFRVWVTGRVGWQAGKLTALQVAKAKTPGMYGDGGGLYLQVARGGSKSWIFRYRFKGSTSKAGKPLAREMGLSSVRCDGRLEGTWTLAEARERARLQRQLLDMGGSERSGADRGALEEAKAVAFEDCAKDYISAHRSGWKNAKHGDRWTATLKTWAYPIIGKLCQLAPLPLIW
jgi:Arm DNA-binding domain